LGRKYPQTFNLRNDKYVFPMANCKTLTIATQNKDFNRDIGNGNIVSWSPRPKILMPKLPWQLATMTDTSSGNGF